MLSFIHLPTIAQTASQAVPIKERRIDYIRCIICLPDFDSVSRAYGPRVCVWQVIKLTEKGRSHDRCKEGYDEGVTNPFLCWSGSSGIRGCCTSPSNSGRGLAARARSWCQPGRLENPEWTSQAGCHASYDSRMGRSWHRRNPWPRGDRVPGRRCRLRHDPLSTGRSYLCRI